MENSLVMQDVANMPQEQGMKRPNSLNTERIVMGQRFADENINYAKLLRAQFPKLNGSRLTLYHSQGKPQTIQFKLSIAVKDIRNGYMDSVYRNVDELIIKKIIHNIFPSSSRVKISGRTQRQCRGNGCGMLAMAFATSLALEKIQPHKFYEQDMMRIHVV